MIARAAVLQSGFAAATKQAWLGGRNGARCN
jgi:hypothetical protein